MSSPSEVNFFLYPARDLVELFVTKNIFLPASRSFWSVSGIPSIRESPFLICDGFVVNTVYYCE